MVRDVTGVKKLLYVTKLAVLGLICLGVAAGFAGALHPAADSLALLRMPLGFLCFLAVMLTMPKLLRAALLISALAAAATTAPPWFGGRAGGDLVIYSKNQWYHNAELPALAADIRSSGADVVLLQELFRDNDSLPARLAADYPYQHACWFSEWSGVAILSKHPLGTAKCTSRRAAAMAVVQRGEERFVAASVHLPWPYPFSQDQSVRATVELLAEFDLPVVVGGDFNNFPWASGVNRIRQEAGSYIAGPLQPTFYLRGVPLTLDHVYAPGGGQVTYRPMLGSDHLGVLARVRLDQ